MNSVGREIFRAIHEGKWLRIEYKNQKGELTKYWGGIISLDAESGKLNVDGLHLSKYTIAEKMTISIQAIQSADVVDGTYCEINKNLVNDIAENPEKYEYLFGNTANLKILSYLEECNRMDKSPFCNDHTLITYLDDSQLHDGYYGLSDRQFSQIIDYFQLRVENKKNRKQKRFQQLAMNLLSICTSKGLYVLAYRVLNLDVKEKCFRPDENITICTEFLVDGTQSESIRKYLDADDYDLLYDFEKNQETIKDSISRNNPQAVIDDVPHIIGIERSILVDLHKEYKSVYEQYETGKVTVPIQAFFGNLLAKPDRRKAYPLAIITKVNMDQLLAINNAMKYPLAYIQGPPGTGKTNTIINTIVTAFFNNRTVLFSSNNNHPLDNVVEKLTSMRCRGWVIPFPILRLGNNEKILEAIRYINALRKQVSHMSVFEEVLDKRKAERIERAKQLALILRQYEALLEYKDREEALEKMIDFQEKHPGEPSLLPFTADLAGRQLSKIRDEIKKRDTITESSALELLDKNEQELLNYLNFTSAKYIKRLEGEKFQTFRTILEEEDETEKIIAFNKYTQDPDNLKKLLQVFPVIVTTCISASRLGDPKPVFDMVIMDEASQCNTAVSLVPILRGENLMLVGDPQQLRPVILLDALTNNALKKKYQVSDEYDYRENSIYKTFLACDSVSDEVLLRKHYRCNRKIIEFNNKKYYNSQLDVKTQSEEKTPLVFTDIHTTKENVKNSSREETEQVVSYVLANKNKSVGIITPFVNQKKLIEEELKKLEPTMRFVEQSIRFKVMKKM